MNTRPKPYDPTAGWLEDFPQRHGMDGARLLAIRPHVEAKLPHVRSIAIARHGYIVFEQYRQGFGRESSLNLASVTKSVTSLLLGIAIDQGALSLDDRLQTRFPGLIENGDARAQSITVRHLAGMTAGFAWSDQHIAGWLAAGDQPRYPLRTPLAAEPGAVFNYDTPASHLLSAVLQRACGMSLLDFADARLFGPLGITQREWAHDADGYTYGGHGLSLNTRDALKLGLLCLQRGMWAGRRIVSGIWLDESTRALNPGYPHSFGAYGFLWWVQALREHPAYYAAGSGGQFLYIVPGLDLLVLVTSNHDRLHAENKQIARDFAVPACDAAPDAPHP